MRRPKFSFLLSLAIGAGVILHPPLRRLALDLFRLPLVVTESALTTLLHAPLLPRLLHENAELRADLTASRLEITTLRETLRHLTRAQALTRGVSHGIVASILGRTILPMQQSVLLDKGGRQGIRRDSILLDVHGLVGRVFEVNEATSLAMLLTDPESRIACLIERSRESALLVGTGESVCRLTYLDADADVLVNDLVVTAGLEGPIPKGLVIGAVVKVLHQEPQAKTAAWVRPTARLSQVEEVVCLPPAS